MSPPLSIAGVRESLRWPTPRDIAFTLKAFAATGLCLLVGFSQNLLNPYWSCLTVYIVLMQPESGAIRSKAFYRLVGTVGGGLLILFAGGNALSTTAGGVAARSCRAAARRTRPPARRAVDPRSTSRPQPKETHT